jgi:hypothetical protein
MRLRRRVGASTYRSGCQQFRLRDSAPGGPSQQRSGFRHAAQTPRRRVNLQVRLPHFSPRLRSFDSLRSP